MDTAGILEQFGGNMPNVAVEALAGKLESKPLADGVSRIMSGHHDGVAYRFFNHIEYNPTKSAEAGYEVFDTIECIQWLIDKRTKPVRIVTHLEHELLHFNKQLECIGGSLKDAYLRFKEGKETPGTALAKWDVLTDAEIATLSTMNIYTVEQLAEQPEGKIIGRLPESYIEAYKRAKLFVASRLRNADLEQQQSQIELLMKRLEALEMENKELRDAPKNEVKIKKAGRPRKEK